MENESIQTSKTISQLTRDERQALNDLSKEVYGASSRWQKLVNDGFTQLVTEEVTEYVPNAEDESKEGTTSKANVPVLYKGLKHSVQTRYTVDEVRAIMLDRKTKLNEIKAMFKKQQDDAREKKEQEHLASQVQAELGGSALESHA